MKKVYIFFLLFAGGINAQELSLKDLSETKTQLVTNIQTLQDSLKKINYEISRIKSDSLKKEANSKTIITKTSREANLKNGSNPHNETIKVIPKGVEVAVVGVSDKTYVYKVCIDDVCGFMNEVFLQRTEELKNFEKTIEEQREKEKEQQILARFEERVAERKALEAKMLKKYGRAQFDKMMEGKIWIGMTTEQCRMSWGAPTKINRSVGSWGTHEQWVYSKSDVYVYFENDKLTSWQD